MYVQGVPAHLHISESEQLVEGEELWFVGQGGISSVIEPELIGTFQGFDEDSFVLYETVEGERSRKSMRDCHVLPQQYNNWYLCTSQRLAYELYYVLKMLWDQDEKYERARQEFINQCDRMEGLIL